MLLFSEEVGNAALPPALESGGEETLFQKGHLGLHCLYSLHLDCCGFIQRGDDRGRLKQRDNKLIVLIHFIFNFIITEERQSVLSRVMRYKLNMTAHRHKKSYVSCCHAVHTE